MRRWLGAALVAALCFAFGAPVQATGTAEPPLKPAQDWLALMDAARYGEAWDAASAVFRNGVAREDWVAKATSARGTLGTVRSRKAGQSVAETNPPGAPAGEYVRIEFDTKFAASTPDRKELVVLIRNGDGFWRVVGYFVR